MASAGREDGGADVTPPWEWPQPWFTLSGLAVAVLIWIVILLLVAFWEGF
jgi:hypothetical protein